MNYQKIYDDLIHRGKNRTIDDQTESHHIIPRCMGGSDEKSNLVKLTPEEHYLAHQLLVKIYPENHALVKAATVMIFNRPSNKLYGWLRRRFVIAKSIEQTGTGNSQYGTIWITNEVTGDQKKISKDDTMPTGWIRGRVNLKLDADRKKKKEEKKLKESIARDAIIAQHRDWYELYSKVGFDEFKKITNYSYSKQNLVMGFKRYLPEFTPQNGKKRG